MPTTVQIKPSQSSMPDPGRCALPSRSSGHWLMEERPAATIEAIQTFLDAKR